MPFKIMKVKSAIVSNARFRRAQQLVFPCLLNLPDFFNVEHPLLRLGQTGFPGTAAEYHNDDHGNQR
jgi:hypothetical protein